MLQVGERFRIRDLHRKGFSISAIARQTGRDRKTVRNVINQPLRPTSKLRRPRPCKIDPYIAYLEKRVNEGEFNARRLYREIRERGYPGKETRVRDFVRCHRPQRAR